MTIAQLSFRSIAVAAALLAAGASASAAGLTIPINFTVSNSVQTFSKDAMGGFRVMEIAVEAKGNGTPVAGDPASYSFPVTQIVIGSKLNVAAGAAVGSALQITRLNDDSVQIGLTVANFTINYDTKQVLADTTIFGGNPATDTAKQMPLYNFTVATPLALKYKFPLSITGHEVLNNLRLTDQAKAAMIADLQLPDYAVALLSNDFGSLTQDITLNIRKPAASTTPYVPAH